MKNDFIKSAIKLYNKTAEALYMTPVDFSEISTDNCRMLWLNAGFKPKCSQYGNMLGGFYMYLQVKYITSDFIFMSLGKRLPVYQIV